MHLSIAWDTSHFVPESDDADALQQTTFRLTKLDRTIIDDVQRRRGFPTRTEALRFILRQFDDFERAADKKGRR